MVVGYGIITLRIPESGSLKSKRSVLNRILRRAQNEFNVSIAETGRLDNHQFAEISFAVVGNESRYINSKIDHLLTFIDHLQVAEILDNQTEIMVISSFPDTTGRDVRQDDEF